MKRSIYTSGKVEQRFIINAISILVPIYIDYLFALGTLRGSYVLTVKAKLNVHAVLDHL